MASVCTLAPFHTALLAVVQAVFASVTFPVSASSSGLVAVHDSVAPQKPTYPYWIVGDGGSETPCNTLGDAEQPKFGGEARVPIRLVTQYPTSKAQTLAIFGAAKAAIDGKAFVVAGFGSVLVTVEAMQVLQGSAVAGGPTVFEVVAECEAELHQGNA